MSTLKIDYQHLQKWKNQTGISNLLLQDTARRFSSSNITNAEIGRRLCTGRPFPGEVILAWQKAYGWSQDETAYYLLNGKINDNKPLAEYTSDEILKEIGRRATE